jgi:hypothetical protein
VWIWGGAVSIGAGEGSDCGVIGFGAAEGAEATNGASGAEGADGTEGADDGSVNVAGASDGSS